MSIYKIHGITPERHAIELLRELSIPLVPTINLQQICAKKNIQISYRPLESAAALLLSMPGSGAKILLNSNNKYCTRDNFSIAHELGHYHLPGHHQAQYKCDIREIFRFNSSDDKEREANRYAAELLMPEPWLKLRIKMADVTLPLIISIAEDCQDSLTATAIKITRICPDRVGIAYSEDGVIKWTAKTKSFPYELRKGLVNERSSINEFIITGCLSGDLRQIHPSAWVDSPYQGSHDWPCELSSAQLVNFNEYKVEYGGDTGDDTGRESRANILTAQAVLEPAQLQDLADLIPQLLIIKAKANLPFKFIVNIEVGDGEEKPSEETVQEINMLLKGVKENFNLQ